MGDRRDVGKGCGGLSDTVRMEEDASSVQTMPSVTGEMNQLGQCLKNMRRYHKRNVQKGKKHKRS